MSNRAAKIGLVMVLPWLFTLLVLYGEIYIPVITAFTAIVYSVTLKDEPNSWQLRLSALAATLVGGTLDLFAFNIIGKKVFLGDLFSPLFYLTALAVLTILLTNDAASVIRTIRKRSGKTRENGALTQKSPAAAVVICSICALTAAAFPIILILFQNAFEILYNTDYRSYFLLAEVYFIPAFIPSLYFRLIPAVHKRYVPLAFSIAGIAGTIIAGVIFQKVLYHADRYSFGTFTSHLQYASAAGFTVFAAVPIAELIRLSRNTANESTRTKEQNDEGIHSCT